MAQTARPLPSRCRKADNQATMGVRLPTILAKAINDVYETLNQIVSLGTLADGAGGLCVS